MAQLPDATKRRALGLLAGGMTAAAVAREVDLSHKTILRWRDAAADAITDDPAERAAIHALTAFDRVASGEATFRAVLVPNH
jgi:transposase-like protein